MPTHTTSTAPLFFYTATTPSGRRASVGLEEFKAAYPDTVNYETRALKMYTPDGQNEQKEDWYLQINPNGRIPAMVDRTADDFVVVESAAILLYLARKFDTERNFSFDPVKEVKECSELEQWIFFAHGGLAPTSGLVWIFNNFFKQYKDEKMHGAACEWAIGQTRTYLGVLNTRLEGRDYLVGQGRGKFTIADMNVYAWVAAASWSGIPTLDEFPNLKVLLDEAQFKMTLTRRSQAWFECVSARPAVQAGMNVPPNTW
ncbi:glutathione S-transferase [Auriculariales sp. MPI-PUGE-AT-0066]|nr:glutathione S-transferase [Auriculariales sp. MPI-PUGE-AT-0066]